MLEAVAIAAATVAGVLGGTVVVLVRTQVGTAAQAAGMVGGSMIQT